MFQGSEVPRRKEEEARKSRLGRQRERTRGQLTGEQGLTVNDWWADGGCWLRFPGNRNGLIHPSSSQRITVPQPSLSCRDCWNFLFYSLNIVFVVVVALSLLSTHKIGIGESFCAFTVFSAVSGFFLCTAIFFFSNLPLWVHLLISPPFFKTLLSPPTSLHHRLFFSRSSLLTTWIQSDPCWRFMDLQAVISHLSPVLRGTSCVKSAWLWLDCDRPCVSGPYLPPTSVSRWNQTPVLVAFVFVRDDYCMAKNTQRPVYPCVCPSVLTQCVFLQMARSNSKQHHIKRLIFALKTFMPKGGSICIFVCCCFFGLPFIRMKLQPKSGERPRKQWQHLQHINTAVKQLDWVQTKLKFTLTVCKTLLWFVRIGVWTNQTKPAANWKLLLFIWMHWVLKLSFTKFYFQ